VCHHGDVKHTIELDEERDRALRHLAEREGRTVSAVVQQAVDDYLARRDGHWSPPDDEWRAAFDAAVARLRGNGPPPDMTAEEIDAEVDAAVAEVRAEMPLHKRVQLHAQRRQRGA
jgi:predicted transcriptional regulator